MYSRDFEFWWFWYQRTIYRDINITKDMAYEKYNEYYSCNCQSCAYRKEKGFPPVKANPDCTAPDRPLGAL